MIEVLVVIATIAILAALLLPALTRAKEEGRSAVCKSNLRQMGVALETYTEDFQAYPSAIYINSEPAAALSEGMEGFWFDELAPYANARWTTNLFAGLADSSSQLFLCPSYPNAVGAVAPWPSALYWNYEWKDYGAYGYNMYGTRSELVTNGDGYFPPGPGLGLGGGFLSNGMAATTFIPPTKVNSVVSPSHMIAIGDANFTQMSADGTIPFETVGASDLNIAGGSLEWQTLELGTNPSPALDPGWPADQKRHPGPHRNIVFCDGHVEALSLSQLFDGQNNAVKSQWNNDFLPH